MKYPKTDQQYTKAKGPTRSKLTVIIRVTPHLAKWEFRSGHRQNQKNKKIKSHVQNKNRARPMTARLTNSFDKEYV